MNPTLITVIITGPLLFALINMIIIYQEILNNKGRLKVNVRLLILYTFLFGVLLTEAVLFFINKNP